MITDIFSDKKLLTPLSEKCYGEIDNKKEDGKMKLRKSTTMKVVKKLKTFFSFVLKGLSILIPIVGTVAAIAVAAWNGAKAAYKNSRFVRNAVDTVTDKVENLLFEQGNPKAEAKEQELMSLEDFNAMEIKPTTIDMGTQTPQLGEVGPIESPMHPPKMASVVFKNVEKLIVTSLPDGNIQFTMSPTASAAA